MSARNQFTPPRKSLLFRTATDEILTVTSTEARFTNPSHSTIRVAPLVMDGTRPDDHQVQDLHIAYSGNYDSILTDFLDARIEQRLAAQGGEFIVARSSRPDIQGLVLWRGRHHEIAAWLPAPNEDDGVEPLAKLGGLTFSDTEIGMTVTPTSPDRLVTLVEVSNDVDGIGRLTVFPSQAALGWIPEWSGKRIAVGEIWKKKIQLSSESPVQNLFTVAAPTAVVNLDPEFNAEPPYSKQTAFLDSLREVSLSESSETQVPA